MQSSALKDGVEDVDKFYNREKDTLKLMRDLNHGHLIKAIAAFQKGNDKFFVFPWAQGGNLDEFWKSCEDSLDKDLVCWAVRQMTGISEGLRELHQDTDSSGGTRHGDLKPENILRFTNTSTGSRWGDLVVADVGLAKYHPDYTQERFIPTTNRYGTLLYTPPEAPSNTVREKLPRRYDVWGLGCIFLEFTIWIIHGPKGRDEFVAGFEKKDTFWSKAPNGVAQTHRNVKEKIDAILKTDLKSDSPLRQLVQLIDKELLVPAWRERAKAERVVERLNKILESCSKESYQFGPDLLELAKKRSTSVGGATQSSKSLSKQVS